MNIMRCPVTFLRIAAPKIFLSPDKREEPSAKDHSKMYCGSSTNFLWILGIRGTGLNQLEPGWIRNISKTMYIYYIYIYIYRYALVTSSRPGNRLRFVRPCVRTVFGPPRGRRNVGLWASQRLRLRIAVGK